MRVTAEEHDVCRDELLGGSTASDSQVDGDMISGSGKGRTGGERWGWADQAAGHLCGCKGEVAVIDTHVLVAGGSTGRELIWREMLVSSVTPREEGAMLSRWMHWCLAPRESQEDEEEAWDREDGLKKKK